MLAGSTTITASFTSGGATYTSAPVPLDVQAEPILRAVVVTPENPTLTLGCYTATVSVFGVYGDDSVGAAPMPGVTWRSADEAVATVSVDGVVTPIGLGTTTITASVDGFLPVSTSVTVTDTTVLSYVSVRPGSIRVGSSRLVNGTVVFSCPVSSEMTVRLSIANVVTTEPGYAFFASPEGTPMPGEITATFDSGSTVGFAVTTMNPGDGTFGAKRVKHRVEITATRDPDPAKSALLRVRP